MFKKDCSDISGDFINFQAGLVLPHNGSTWPAEGAVRAMYQ